MADAQFPYDITKIITGPARVVYAPTSVAVPTNIKDVQLMVSPYTLATGWKEFGAAKSAPVYGRDIATSQLEIEQETAAIRKSVTDVARSISLSLSELAEDNVQIMEQAPSVGTIAAGTGKSAQKAVLTGGFTTLNQYRIALIGRRNPADILVTEPGGATRGGLVMVYLSRATLSADSVEAEFAKGSLTEAKVKFDAEPEPGVSTNSGWFFEQAGVIA